MSGDPRPRALRTMPGTTAPRNGLPESRGYRYGGTGRDTLTPRRGGGPKPRPRPSLPAPDRLPRRCLDALAALGGDATGTQVLEWLRRQGLREPGRPVSQVLLELSRRTPPLVVPAGWAAVPGRRPSRRWRLARRCPDCRLPAPDHAASCGTAGADGERCGECGYVAGSRGCRAECGGSGGGTGA